LYGQQKYNQEIITQSTNEIVEEIKKKNVLEGKWSDFDRYSQQYLRCEKLMEIASKEELLELINHPNGVVRCYAFRALSYNKSVDLFPILLNHIKDTELVNTRSFSTHSKKMVGDFFIDVVTHKHNYFDLEVTKLDTVQIATLDSILIYSNSVFFAKSDAILRAKQTELLYPIMKKMFIKDNNQYALVALAKYKKQEDIQLILKSKRGDEGYSYKYKAIQEFPHDDFFPLLEENLNKILEETPLLEKKLKKTLGKTDYNVIDFEIFLEKEHYGIDLEELYKAIAAYKNKKAVDLLNISSIQVKQEDVKKYHIDFVYKAIDEYKSKIYDSLLWEFWIKENRISPDVYQYLIEKDSLKAFELTKKNIADTREIYYVKNNYCFDNCYSNEILISMMLDFILKKDFELGLKMIIRNLKYPDFLLVDVFIDKTIELKDKSFVEPLFELLAKGWTTKYLKVVEALLLHRDNSINERILKMQKKDFYLRTKEVDELLKMNNIK
jgi:hypothetical protein